MKHKVLIVGGLSKTAFLAQSLNSKGYAVTIINSCYEDCLILAENSMFAVIYGDGTNPKVLENAKAYKQDLVISMLKDDSKNLVVCELCKKLFNVNKTVALISNPSKIEFFKKMGIDSVVCAISAITDLIEQNAIIEELSTKISIAEGNIVINEWLIDGKNIIVDKKLWELNLPKGVIIGCIIRGNDTVVPRGDTRIKADDKLIILAKTECEIQLRKILGRSK